MWILAQLPLQPGSRQEICSGFQDTGYENYMDFLNGEVRYNSLQRQNPEKAARLFAKNESEAKARYAYLNKLVAMYGEEE